MTEEPKKSPLQEIVQPFIDLVRAPRALMGIYVSYFLEGLVYFGILTILGKYMSENVALTDQWAGLIYGFFTAGITLAMLFLGGVGDKIGIRKALFIALSLMVVGRFFVSLSGVEAVFTPEEGLGSGMFWSVVIGLFIVVIGYGIYQPASYAGVKQFTDAKTATMGYAVIYALMNLGAFVAGLLAPPIRQSLGIGAVYWVFTFFTFCAVLSIFFILTKKTEIETTAAMKEKREKEAAAKEEDDSKKAPEPAVLPSAWTQGRVVGFALGIVGVILGITGTVYFNVSRELPDYEAKVAELIVQAEETVKAGSKTVDEVEVQEEGPPKTGPWLQKLMTGLSEWQILANDAAVSMKAPEDFDGTVDETGKTCMKGFLASQGGYAKDLLEVASKYAAHELNTETAQSLKELIRAHGIFAMSLAYSMLAEVDEDVVTRLRKRFKQRGEEIIPMTDALAQDSVMVAKMDLPYKMRRYGEHCINLAGIIESKAPEGSLDAPAAWFRETGRFASEAASRLEPNGGEGVKKILSDKLLTDADYALEVGNSLVEVEAAEGFMEFLESAVSKVVSGIASIFVSEEEVETAGPSNLTYLNDGLRTAKGVTEKMKDNLGEVFQVPLGTRVTGFLLRFGPCAVVILVFLILALWSFLKAKPDHPFNNLRFVYFIFILIPVQTLFAHNWLTLPYYINRAFGGTWVGDWFEFFSNINPLLIFILAPMVAALTAKANVFKMMMLGTFIMAVPTFLLVLPPNVWILLTYILIMTIGEAIWQPRFLQYVAELAPEGKTGIYMGIAQFPWFMTKVLTSLYSGWFLSQYCPRIGPQSPETMWLWYAFIAMISPIALILTGKWIQAGMKTKTSGA